jgi:dienelactone hydrolase
MRYTATGTVWIWRTLAALLLMAGVAHAEDITLPGPDGIELKSRLFQPPRAGPVPAIVLLHGCGGPFPSRDKQWTDLFTNAGQIVLLPDSFSSRGLGSQCNTAEGQRTVTPGGLRRRDALAAARWLAARPGTPPGGVVIMGWSNGGATTLAIGNDLPDVPKGLIRGLIAFYPGCASAARSASWKPLAPLLVLVGEADDWTPAAPCHALERRLGSAMTLVPYPGAYHDFDAPDMPVRLRGSARGQVHVGTDPTARADALARVPAFIATLRAAY